MKRLTIKAVNKNLSAAGIKDELVKGQGYFYFWGDKASSWYSSSVMVPYLNDLTIEQWIAEYIRLAKEND
jgi:hypothetical protein